ncbi:MAG: metallophosphoesterase [Thermoguttaceae bacterium]
METILLAAALLWGLFGHMVLCVALVNRAHATTISRRAGKLVWLSVFVLVPSIPALIGTWFWARGSRLGVGLAWSAFPPGAVPYLAVCWLAALWATLGWLRRRLGGSPVPLRSSRRRVFRLRRAAAADETDAPRHHFLVHLPGNQTLDLDVVERGLDLPGLPQALDRLTVLHLSDLHFTGRIAKGYFEEAVRICNDLEPDLVAITGDLVDNADCLAWIPDTLGRLRSRCGCYFVLGNHDAEVGAAGLRRALEETGLIDLGSRWLELGVGGERIVLAGNELPWFPPAADLATAPPPSRVGGPLRIALSHSPDQLAWARRNEVDLLLAGHLHGGQIRLPVLGPIVSPSRHGVRYASGLFHAEPTVMHVSRGVSAEIPVRLNCGPEIAKLTLHAVGGEGRPAVFSV